MVFIIKFIFTMAFFPGVFPNIDLGFAYLTLLRVGLLLLPVITVNKYCRQVGYKSINPLYSYNRFYLLFSLIWFLYSLATVFWVKDFSAWAHAEYFLLLFVYCTFFFTMGALSLQNIISIFKWICIIMFIHSIVGWTELFFHNYFFAPINKVNYMIKHDSYYAISTFGNLNDFAFAMVLGSFVAHLSYVNSCKKLGKFFFLITMLSCILHVVRSNSRSCILALVFGWGIYFLVTLTNRKKIYILVCVIGLILGFIFFMPNFFMQIATNIIGKLSFTFHKDILNSDMIRVNLIRNGFEFLKQTGWFGVGSGNTETWMATKTVYNTGEIVNMHNWWMENFTNYGLVVFLLYLLFYISLIVTFGKGVRLLSGVGKTISAVIVSVLCAFIIGLMSSSSFFTTEWLWVFFALLIAMQRLERIECKKMKGEI